MTNENALQETQPCLGETKSKGGKDWSLGNWFLKLYLGGLIFSYLFIAVLSGDWSLPLDTRPNFLYVTSWMVPFILCLVGCAKAIDRPEKRKQCFWYTVALEFCWGIGCWFFQPDTVGNPTFFGNGATWAGAYIAFFIGGVLAGGRLCRKYFF